MKMDIHGGNIYKLQREGKKGIIDYSSNINPLGVPESLKKAIVDNFSLLEKYPDINYVELRENIGNYNKINSENIIVGNGATEVLFLYMKALKPKKVLIVSPTFAEYERALKNIECEIDFFELKEKENFVLDKDEFIKEAKKYNLVVICNPNNPTGNFISKEIIFEINEELEKSDTKIFIDESFIEFIKNWEEKTVAEFKSKNIFILRALTKFFALPGIRLGYGICFDKNIIDEINSKREPWSVNTFADIAGKVILDDKEYIENTYKWIEEERKNFTFSLKEIEKSGKIKVYKTETNFILLKLNTYKAEEFRNKMLEKNILVRDASNFKFLDETFVRLAIKDRERNEKVIKAIKEVL
ncbi:histidinol-phosphate transaminase [Fusobacterium sp.]|uniref:pyridoxal phosphate-dependent aminotransferase n=1 Tax=Fusobacterium sp. TaxID=68766 RepID=UPI0026168190|nr:histidinol-phosphate transaminase [Fusobacterium sp.]